MKPALHLAASQWSEFDGSDLGLGGRLTWKPASLIGVDADLTWYPSDFPDRIAFSGNRFEGLFGVTVGPQLESHPPVRESRRGISALVRSAGAVSMHRDLSTATQLPDGSGTHDAGVSRSAAEWRFDARRRTFLRVDVADRILEYPGPSFDPNFERRDDGFFGHALRFTIGGGVRF